MVPHSPINSLLSSFPSHSRPHLSLVRQKNVTRQLSQNRGVGKTVWNDWCHLHISIWPQLQREKKLYVRGKRMNKVKTRWPGITKIKNQNKMQKNPKTTTKQNPPKTPKPATTKKTNQKNTLLLLGRRQMLLFKEEMKLCDSGLGWLMHLRKVTDIRNGIRQPDCSALTCGRCKTLRSVQCSCTRLGLLLSL